MPVSPVPPPQPAARLGFRILGSGSYLPKTIFTSREVDAKLGWPAGQTEAKFGLYARHIADAEETSSMMAAAAAVEALGAAGLAPDDLDLIIGGCGVMEQAIPSTATLVQARLGLGSSGIAAYDVNATCLSFVQALDLAAMQITLGRARHVLVFSSDISSGGVDWSVPETAAIFGDGAAAVVLGPATAAGEGALAARLETYSVGREACVLAGGGTRMARCPDPVVKAQAQIFQMDGVLAWRHASRRLPRFLRRLMDEAGVGLEQIACIIPHQASGGALDHGLAALGLPPDKVVRVFGQMGNQIASSIPNALHAAISGGRLQRGELALILGSSAGISLGGMVVRY